MSSTALNYYALSVENHLKRMQECTKIKGKHELVEYLKKTHSNILAQCYKTDDLGEILIDMPWVPTVETNSKGAFFTKKPEEIYKSNKAPVMDAMFSFTSQVDFDIY